MPTLDLDLVDIQGFVARGYAPLKAASYILLEVTDTAAARGWLGGLVEQVTPAPASAPQTALNVALSASGLSRLGLSSDVLDQFPNELVAGMTTPHRRRSFGDVGPSAPEGWLWGGPTTPPLDVLLLVFAPDAARLASTTARLAVAYAGLREVIRLETAVDLDGREHFGFADGISQPTVDGLSSRTDIPPNTIAAGEFILGYPNEYGLYTDRPLLDRAADPNGVLPLDAQGSGRADLGRNGSYVIFRHLRQDVRGFWRFVDQAAGERREWLAARMVGRWPSGAPVTLAPDADDSTLAGANDFTYAYGDARGLKCPIGAHVRRCHPRDSLDPDPGTVRSVALDKRHRLLRRGREYGPPVAPADRLGPTPPDDPERGLYFLCVAANIARQFEFIQSTWLNNPKFDQLYDEPDPLVGNHTAAPSSFSVPMDPVRLRYEHLPQFVTVRGGGYFFLPGLRALRYLASLPG